MSRSIYSAGASTSAGSDGLARLSRRNALSVRDRHESTGSDINCGCEVDGLFDRFRRHRVESRKPEKILDDRAHTSRLRCHTIDRFRAGIAGLER